ncbi:MAG: protein kinase [Myxococcaceae bacterium]|jgi:serine/threonine-protein kinase|nr:protein kinase [Myxococcaceae bacterium]
MTAFEFALPGAPGSPGFRFPGPRFIIGSAPEAGLRFDARLVQPQHAEVAFDPSGVPWIRDLSNGQLWLNGVVVQKARLTVGAQVRLGRLELEVRDASAVSEVPLDSTARRPTPFATPPMDATAKRPTPFQAPAPVRTSGVGRVSGARTPAVTGEEKTSLSGAYVPSGSTREAPAVSDDTFMRTVLPEGAVIGGRYRIIKKLAAGGMGEVYQAEHVELHKQFAVKVMLPALSSDQEFVNRFKREAISASRIGQQNIIDISDFGQTDEGRFYFVMEFLDGLTIASVLHRQGAMPIVRMVNVGLQVARALAAAHAQGIVHRDMKPENVMVLQRPGQPDFVKVLDFGVAKVSTGPGQGGQTQLGMVVGTPQYMSPEQAMGVAVDTRTDTYALGLIFYEMLTGKPTFAGDTASILMVKQVTEPAPPFPPEVTATLPAALHDLVFKMLEKDPNARPQTLDEVVNVLETLQAHLKVGAKLAPATASGRFPQTATPHTVSAIRVTATGAPIAATQPVAPPAGAQAVVAEDSIAPPARSKLPFVVLGLVLLAAAAGGAVVLLKSEETVHAEVIVANPEPKPPEPKPIEKVPEAPPTPKVVQYTLDTEPQGAEVFENEILLGTTPFVLARAPEAVVELTFKLKGYVDLTRKVKVPLLDSTLQLPLEKKKAGGGPGPGKPTKPQGDLADPYATPTEDLKNPFD